MLQYQQLNNDKQFPIELDAMYPIINEYTHQAGEIDNHYFFQDIWAAKKILKNNPKRHIDIGSRIDGFISHLLCFRTVEQIDIRPLNLKIPGLSFIQDDATELKTIKTNSIESISSLHACEHFGLGRYGDTIDPNAYVKFIHNMQRVVKKKGNIYFSVPIGKERLEFNAHRIFNPLTIIELFKNCSLHTFSVVDDSGSFIDNCTPNNYTQLTYGCGMFHFSKK